MIISLRVFSFVMRRCANVFPSEEYGFLIGTKEPTVIYGALPVGRTLGADDYSGRFRGMVSSLGIAKRFTSALGMALLASYCSEAEYIDSAKPVMQHLPEGLRHIPIFSVRLWGGEILARPSLFAFSETAGWQPMDFRKTKVEAEARYNQRRIHAEWKKTMIIGTTK